MGLLGCLDHWGCCVGKTWHIPLRDQHEVGAARQPVWILDEAAGVELFRGTPCKTGYLGMKWI